MKTLHHWHAPDPTVVPEDMDCRTGTSRPVLIVEDDPINQTLLSIMLIQLGHPTEVAGCGEEAVERAGSTDYRAILMDQILPRMCGDAAAREIRRLPGARGRVPIISLSGTTGHQERRRFQDAGMDHHVGKPFTMRDLDHALRRCDRVAF